MKKKMTGKDISTADLLFAVGDGATFAQIGERLGLPCDSRALDGALQREKRAGRLVFDKAERRWVKSQPSEKPKRGGRKMRIEKRGDTEHLVDCPRNVGFGHTCEAERDGWTCSLHFNGEHVATMGMERNRTQEICVRWPIEPASPTPLRPAEEIAREMVPESVENAQGRWEFWIKGAGRRGTPADVGIEDCGTKRGAELDAEGVRLILEGLIERSRSEGAAPERARAEQLEAERDEARAWVRRLTAAERVLTCVYCGQAYPPGTPDHGAGVLTAHVRVCEKHPMREVEADLTRLHAERERVAPLLRAARRWAAEARRTGRAAEEQIAADIDLAEAVDALDVAPATRATQPRDLAGPVALRKVTAPEWDACEYRCGCTHYDREECRRWAEELVSPCGCGCHLVPVAVAQPRDLAGRIRALVQQKLGEWLDAGVAFERSRSDSDRRTAAALQGALADLRDAYIEATTEGRLSQDTMNAMRHYDSGRSEEAHAVRMQTARELDAIVRECAQEQQR
ncbi:hypothetical protein WMF30_10870 [Sorangium sp. So ce134]